MDDRLITFCTLCETMNYREAAARLHISQPAVTKQIQSLEEDYGVKLFHYDGRKLHRSAASYVLENYSFSARKNEEELRQKLLEREPPALRIGLSQSIGNYAIPDTLDRYLGEDKHSLELTVENTEKLLELLRRNEKDFLILEGSFDKTAYDYELYQYCLFTGICHRDHPFAGRSIAISEIFQERLIAREQGSGSRKILEDLLALHGYNLDHFNSTVSVSSLPLIVRLVCLNKGITFAYESVLRGSPELATFTVEEISSRMEFNLVALKNTGGLKLARDFLGD